MVESEYVDYLHFFFKHKTAYVMRISDWSSDVCSSDLHDQQNRRVGAARFGIAAPEQKIGVRREIEEQATVDTIRARAIAVYSADVLNKRSQIGRASCRERVCQYV